jgi:hypothetical protein
MRLTPMWIAVIWTGLAVGPWAVAETDLSLLPDPTRPATVGEAEGVRSSGLTSIRITARQRHAVIDGRTVSVGDAVRGGVVQDIRPEEVLIKRGDRVSALRLMPDLKRNVPQGKTGK